MAIHEQTFVVTMNPNGDDQGSDASFVNNPGTDRVNIGTISADPPFENDLCSFFRWNTIGVLPGSYVTKAKFGVLVTNNYTGGTLGFGNRRLGFLAEDGLWDVLGGFSENNYALHSDLPTPTANDSDVLRPGVLHNDVWMEGILAIDTTSWTALTSHSFGENYGDTTDSDIGIIAPLQDIINGPAYAAKMFPTVGIAFDGYLLNQTEDRLQVASIVLGVPMQLTIEWWDPTGDVLEVELKTGVAVTGRLDITPDVEGRLDLSPGASGRLGVDPAASGQLGTPPAVRGRLEIQ